MEKTVKIKICGLTRPQEAEYLNEAGADYGGFVFYGASRRNVTIPQAVEIKNKFSQGIGSVAVTVSPEVKLVCDLEAAGFDILQVHKKLSKEVLKAVNIPVWYAVNLTNLSDLQEKAGFLLELPEALSRKIRGIVVDAGSFGSGKTFDWSSAAKQIRNKELLKDRSFILAGGLNPSNVKEGIRLLQPDVVDVSSGVEGDNGKDKNLILEFTERVKKDE